MADRQDGVDVVNHCPDALQLDYRRPSCCGQRKPGKPPVRIFRNNRAIGMERTTRAAG